MPAYSEAVEISRLPTCSSAVSSAHHGAGRVGIALPGPAEGGEVDGQSGVGAGEVGLTVDDLAHDAADHRGVLELIAARADRDEEPVPLGAVVDRHPVL